MASLKSLNKNDVVEVRAMTRPPAGVKMVIEAVCIMKDVKPKKVAGDKPGERINDYWEPGKALLMDPGKFLEGLFKFDKDNIPDDVIKKIQPLIDNPDFTPAAIAKVSQSSQTGSLLSFLIQFCLGKILSSFVSLFLILLLQFPFSSYIHDS